MDISIQGASPEELGKLIDKLRAPSSSTSSAEVDELRQQVRRLAIVVEAQRQQVEIQYPPVRQLQLPPSPAQLCLPEAPAKLQTQPNPLPVTETQEPGIHLPWWASGPIVNAISAGLIIGTVAFIAWRNWPTATSPKISPTPNSSNLLRVPAPPPGKGTPPPAPSLPAIPQLNP